MSANAKELVVFSGLSWGLLLPSMAQHAHVCAVSPRDLSLKSNSARGAVGEPYLQYVGAGGGVQYYYFIQGAVANHLRDRCLHLRSHLKFGQRTVPLSWISSL